MKIFKDVKLHKIDGGLDLTVPATMSKDDGNKLAKEVGALDMSLHNKFAESPYLTAENVRLYVSFWTNLVKGGFLEQEERYKNLFEKDNDKEWILPQS